MKRLPVPPLAQTMERYLRTVEPLLSSEEFERTRAAVNAFVAGSGPEAQRALEEFAQTEHGAGRNWMSEAWLEAYLVGRDNLTLLSNVAFELAWSSTRHGAGLAADVIHRFAAVHLDYLRGDIGPDSGPRGDELCMRQWRYLAGGLRDPQLGKDVFVPGNDDPANREVVVLHESSGYAVRVSDEFGRPLSRAAIATALATVLEDGPHSDPPFTAPAYLAGTDAARHFSEGLRVPGNADTYARLGDALFFINLISEDRPLAIHMEQAAFGAEQAWPFKPVTLQVGLADDFVGLHIEHSTMDGATVQSVIGRAQEVPDDEPEDLTESAGESATESATGSAGESLAAVPAERLRWNLRPGAAQRLHRAIERYERAASGHRWRLVHVDTGTTLRDVPFKLSLDACFQFVMLYAQLRAHGRLRSTYESVDMREYQAGRTECLRPNTPQAVEFVKALLAGEATTELLRAALDGHREQVKAAKSGQAIDRHLFGLKLMANRAGLPAPIFDDPGYVALTTDALSTTSLGERTRIVRAAFAPTNPGCLGIYYCPIDEGHGGFEFCLNWQDGVTERVDEFADALQEGTDRLMEVLEAAAAE